jgi:hypothetical protein
MLEGHLKGVLTQLFELVCPYVLVADINTRGESGKIDIDPIGILGHRIEKTAVPYDLRIHRIFEGIRKPLLVKGLIFMPGEVDFEITPPFGGIHAIAGNKKKTYY